MKIGILTQPLHDNYGGLLQAYALKNTLESLGHDITIINRRSNSFSINATVKKLLVALGLRKGYYPSRKEKSIISRNTLYFANHYIESITFPIFTTNGLSKISNDYDLFVIGSDQVWRPKYSPSISNYFLDFTLDDRKKGLAYAASFGVDTWEFTQRQMNLCKENIHKFRAISVREDTAVSLCKSFFNVEVVHVLDPTMLLSKDHYVDLINRENESTNNEKLFHYVLDESNTKKDFVNHVAKYFGYETFSKYQKNKPSKQTVKNIENCVYPTVTSWLNGFNSADFIVTDSFHGTVFSILFNKPFLVLVNNKRGSARFTSLLKMFNLEDRMIDDNNMDIDLSLLEDINWTQVNSILEEKRKQSLNFLINNI